MIGYDILDKEIYEEEYSAMLVRREERIDDEKGKYFNPIELLKGKSRQRWNSFDNINMSVFE